MDISKYYFRSKPILSSLNQADSEYFVHHIKLVTVARGVTLYEEGNSCKGVYILRRGKVKIYHQFADRAAQIVYIYTPGEMFGFRPLLTDEKHFTSAMTIEECEIYTLDKKHFQHVVSQSVDLTRILLHNLSHEFTVLTNHITAFGKKSAKARIALSLLIVQEKYRKSGVLQPQIELSRADLAAFAGTTNETLARIISRFKDDKIIRVSGRKVQIINPEALKKLVV